MTALPEELAAAFGGEGLLVVGDCGASLLVRPDDFDDVESAGIGQESARFHEGERGTGHSLSPLMVDGQRWASVLAAASRLYLDEYDRFGVDGDEIDLAIARAMTLGNDSVSQAAEVLCGCSLAALPK
ncbi:hypothetical protein OAS39_09510 [Pirellulales bacterium]|nr:hypothetical protein [Pirellulales bacterium]